MRNYSLCVGLLFSLFCPIARANLAEQTEVRIVRDTAGPTPFIRFVDLVVSDPGALQGVRFSITPKPGSVTRPLSATYPTSYLEARGYVARATGELLVPVFGLYAAFTNDVTVTYIFNDGSSSATSIQLVTETYSDPCGFSRPNMIQPRDPNTPLSYDFILVKNACGDASPTVLDTDGEIRWVGTGGGGSYRTVFFDNAVYLASLNTPQMLRIELDGQVTTLADYSGDGISAFHHNLYPGKTGILFEVITPTRYASTIGEMDRAGHILKIWDLADIISRTMIEGGDDPAQFVAPFPGDWFHDNSACYRSSDNTLIVSSRENFVIGLDYDTGSIKWILGDLTKQWAQFPSLLRFALELTPGGLPPIGQHSVSISHDDNLLLFDDGTASVSHTPAGDNRTYSAARKYSLDFTSNQATEVWNYDAGQSLYSSYCSSAYEDEGLSLLLDYSYIVNLGSNQYAELVGLTPAGRKVFEYRYPTVACDEAFNSEPLHWENIVYPSVPFPTPTPTPTATPVPSPTPSPTVPPSPTATPTPSASPSPTATPTASPRPTPPDIVVPGPLANVSSRGIARQGDDVMIGGFIITGNLPKKVVIRGLGPSMANAGLKNVIADPTLELHDSKQIIATNDNFVSDNDLKASGLEPSDPHESAIVISLHPGAYTAVLRDKNNQSGLGLVEIYDIDPSSSRIGNLSTRARVEADDNVLIGGFIIHDGPAKILVRALGPSLQSQGVTNALQDPMITLYNADGSVLGENEAWQSDQAAEIIALNLAPSSPREAAIITTVPNGNYTAVVSNQLHTPDTEGVGLIEIYYIAEP